MSMTRIKKPRTATLGLAAGTLCVAGGLVALWAIVPQAVLFAGFTVLATMAAIIFIALHLALFALPILLFRTVIFLSSSGLARMLREKPV